MPYNNYNLKGFPGSIWDLIRESRQRALQEGIKANTIILNKNMVKVQDFAFSFDGGVTHMPTMICGMHAYWTEHDLPEGYSWAILESQVGDRLAKFEAIGMEPDELMKAAELYRKVKEVM